MEADRNPSPDGRETGDEPQTDAPPPPRTCGSTVAAEARGCPTGSPSAGQYKALSVAAERREPPWVRKRPVVIGLVVGVRLRSGGLPMQSSIPDVIGEGSEGPSSRSPVTAGRGCLPSVQSPATADGKVKGLSARCAVPVGENSSGQLLGRARAWLTGEVAGDEAAPAAGRQEAGGKAINGWATHPVGVVIREDALAECIFGARGAPFPGAGSRRPRQWAPSPDPQRPDVQLASG